MLQIGDTLVSLDVVEQFFCCDLDACKGACCIEGDAGAPLSEKEDEDLKAIIPEVLPHLTPRGAEAVENDGHSYLDPEGERVTQLIDGGCCAYACFAPDGLCLCALEKARREGKKHFFKPISCSLYPVRIKDYGNFIAVNYDRWKICRPAEKLGRQKGIRVYEFLKEPLTRRFGEDWYAQLSLVAREWLSQHPHNPLTP